MNSYSDRSGTQNSDSYLQEREPRSILALPFEDGELVSLLQSKYPSAELEVLRKQDIAGLPIPALVSRVRKHRKDLVAASLRNSTANRTTSMMELILSLSRARSRILRGEDGKLHHVSGFQIVFKIFPRLLIGSIVGVVLLGVSQLLSVYFSVLRQPIGRHLARTSEKPAVLFLRTDLAGSLAAGGSVSHIKGMIKAFMKLGYEVIFVADSKSPALPAEATQIVVRPLSVLDFFDEFQLIAFNIQLIMRAGALVRRFKPAMVYQRLSVFNFAGGIIARRAKIPMVLEANASEVWAKKNWSRLLFERLAIRCESLALKSGDKVCIVSEVIREQLSKYGVPDEKYIVCPNGVDPDEFRPDIDGSEVRNRFGLDKKIVIGYIGTFRGEHGVETLCDAAMLAIKQNPQLRFLMIGDGELRSALKNRATEMGFGEYFVFTGVVQHSDAPKYLAACDILVSPHLGFSQGTRFFQSPIKLFEYMSMGKPIIASKLEQIGEVIIDGVNGLWMTPGNAAELAQKIILLADDPELRKKLGNEARRICEERHTWTANARKVLDAIR